MTQSDDIPNLIFYAEGADADDYFSQIEDCGEAAVIDTIVGGGRVDTDQSRTPWPRDEDDLRFEHDDGYTLIYNSRRGRVWLYDRPFADQPSGKSGRRP